ncbi:50S ribosomal protein L13 [Candidatus Microgenomates bacterium]|nr:MAG: 50S ribosomal protein L13 [Candidatus Microgenomates bacterium]
MHAAHTTKTTKGDEIKRLWHEVNADKQVVGRVATEIANKLMGKQKPYYVRHLDCGDYVVVTNCETVVVTGKKNTQKVYTQYSGYPGGLRKETFAQLQARRPEEIIRRAVYGMLPKNKLRDELIKRLYVYVGTNHPYKDKFAQKA